MRSRRWGVCAAFGACALAQALAGCIIQGNKCSPNEVEYTGLHALCLCAPDYVTDSDGTGCVPCGENETAAQNLCVCKAGFGRTAATDPCAPIESSGPCASDAECAPSAPYCAKAGSADSYCTTAGCGSNAQCLTGWSCEAGPTVRYCARPPSGLGASCQSDADCSSYDAKYCDTLVSHTCLIGGCATRATTCPSEWLCCDYSALLGSALSICVSPTTQVSGGCPQGGTKVSP